MRYWPEFSLDGKGTLTVADLLSHKAGLVALDEEITLEMLQNRDTKAICRIFEEQARAFWCFRK